MIEKQLREFGYNPAGAATLELRGGISIRKIINLFKRAVKFIKEYSIDFTKGVIEGWEAES